MTPGHLAAVAVAGIVAGLVNAVAGGGSLLSFPVLLWIGLAPLPANVSNTTGLLPGYLGTTVAYRRELLDQRRQALLTGVVALVGAVLGSVLLLALPASVFTNVVPVLMVIGCLLIVVQPRLSRAAARRRRPDRPGHPPWAYGAVFLGGVYGAYFGAGLGVVLFAILAAIMPAHLQRGNALKSWLSLLINVLAAAIFSVFGPVHWLVALVLAVSSLVGGHAGGRVARRMSDRALRLTVLCVGIAGAIWLLVRNG